MRSSASITGCCPSAWHIRQTRRAARRGHESPSRSHPVSTSGTVSLRKRLCSPSRTRPFIRSSLLVSKATQHGANTPDCTSEVCFMSELHRWRLTPTITTIPNQRYYFICCERLSIIDHSFKRNFLASSPRLRPVGALSRHTCRNSLQEVQLRLQGRIWAVGLLPSGGFYRRFRNGPSVLPKTHASGWRCRALMGDGLDGVLRRFFWNPTIVTKL